MDYSEILTSSGRLVWNRRVLWLIGMLAAFFGQGGYRFSANYNQSMTTPVGSDSALPPSLNQFANQVMQNMPPYIVGIVLLTLIWSLIALCMGWLALGALITIAAREETGWRAAFSHSRSRLAPLLLITIVLALPMLVLIMIAVSVIVIMLMPLFTTTLSIESNPDVFMTRFFGAIACFIPLVFLAILTSLVFQGINIYAARVCLLEELGVGASIRRGWQLLKSNIGYTLLNGLILAAIGLVFGVVAAIPAFALLLMSAPKMLEGIWDTQVIFSLAGLILYSLLMNVVVGGILTSFAETTWTKLYQACVNKDMFQPVAPQMTPFA